MGTPFFWILPFCRLIFSVKTSLIIVPFYSRTKSLLIVVNISPMMNDRSLQ